MYGLDKSEDLSFMIGKDLEQVAVGSYQVILNFRQDLSISIESSCQLIDKSETTTHMSSEDPEKTKNLVCLLGKQIIKANNLGKGSLELSFSGDYKLLLFDDSDNYESYNICSPENRIIV
jgi:Family of unknown function (DUF6188)